MQLRQAPFEEKRADAENLAAEKAWYIAGGFHDEYGRLRSAKLSDKSATEYWNRFCLFVAFIDENGGPHDSVWAYMDAPYLERYFSHIGEGVEKKAKMEPASSGWIDTVKRTMNSLAGCFVWPYVTEDQWTVYVGRIDQARTLCLKAAQAMGRTEPKVTSLSPMPTGQFHKSINSLFTP